jgi:hypothetical protein
MPKVYFLSMQDAADVGYDFGLIKVGITDGDVAARIAQLQTGNPHGLLCLGRFDTPCASQVEHFIHRTHAAQMHHREWLRCARQDVGRLIEEAQAAACRFEERKRKEDAIVSRVTNGLIRRGDREEIKRHREVRILKYQLIPAQLRLAIAKHQLQAATGATNGIEGVVRVKYVAATIQFSPERAQLLFPTLASRCTVEKLIGSFRWRKMPQKSRFVAENHAAKQAAALAESCARQVLDTNTRLDGWAPRTPQIERLHDDFLQATQLVSRLDAELADRKTELTIRMGECEAIDPICSFKRAACSEVDSAMFCRMYPEEAAQCAAPVAAKLRKLIYPTRSYA